MACFGLMATTGIGPTAWAFAAAAALGVSMFGGCDAASGTNQTQPPVKPEPGTTPGTQPGTPAKPDQPPPPAPKVPTEKVVIAGKAFHLEIAADDVTRFRGLSGRTEIAPDGGMLFIFTRASRLEFVMRDCPIPIDIIYLDGSGRVVATHAMLPEPPRGDGERLNDPRTGTNETYERRLKKYPSRFDAQFVIELKGGTLAGLNLKSADKIDLDLARLKKMAK